jgi:osmotically-inducible protein OsmY
VVGLAAATLMIRGYFLTNREPKDCLAAVLKALILDEVVPGTVVARVHDGLVTLVGSAERQYQREKAELVCASVPGVIAVKNEISLTPRSACPRGAHLCGAQ